MSSTPKEPRDKKFKELLAKHDIKDPPCYSGIGDGWIPLVDRLIEDLVVLGWDKDCQQIKEKFGGLRFYVGETTKEMRDVIGAAEQASYKICEACGTGGAKCKETSKNSGYIITLCDPCRAKSSRDNNS